MTQFHDPQILTDSKKASSYCFLRNMRKCSSLSVGRMFSEVTPPCHGRSFCQNVNPCDETNHQNHQLMSFIPRASRVAPSSFTRNLFKESNPLKSCGHIRCRLFVDQTSKSFILKKEITNPHCQRFLIIAKQKFIVEYCPSSYIVS